MVDEVVNIILEAFPSAELLTGEETVMLSVDGEKGVVIEIQEDCLHLHLFKYEWPTSFTRIPSREYWRTMPVDSTHMEIIDQINRARRARRRQYKKCRYCSDRFPPELMTGHSCHACASEYEGVVY